MKVLHVLGEMSLANGIATFVRGICNGLDMYPEVSCEVWEEVHPVPKRLACDVLHVHGLWRPMFHRVSALAHRQGIPVVWSPHGMLQPWALKYKWWKKFVALGLYQWRDLRSAALLHATAQSEVDDIRRLGLRNRVITVPLGVKVGEKVGKVGGDGRRTLLFVSRVQKKKGLPNLLMAWAKIKELERIVGVGGEVVGGGWKVRIVGPDEDGHMAELMLLCDRLAIPYSDQSGRFHCSSSPDALASAQPQVEFVGPKYGDELEREYDNADLFVLPTHSENFGSVVIEALAHEVPVITTKAAPWRELEGGVLGGRCGWWIDVGVESLVKTLGEALATNEGERAEMGRNGRALVERKYTWAAAAREVIAGYEMILK